MKITALVPQERHPERLNLFVDGEFRLGLAAELAFAASLHVGDPIDDESLGRLERRDLIWQAREAALNLLSYRARTEAELRTRLGRKGFPDDVVAECVGDLVGRRLVDDAEFAAAFVRDRVRSRPRGARRLVYELRARGVAEETARSTVDQALERAAVSEVDLAHGAAAAWARRALPAAPAPGAATAGADPRELRRKLYGHLARRGFGGEAIRVAIDAVLDLRRD